MPTYEYICQKCGHEFDTTQSFAEPSLTVCPACGGSLRKKFGSVGVVFKGPGFYRTDSREKPASAKGDAPAKGDQKSAKPEVKTDEAPSKPSEGLSKPAPAPAPTPKPVDKSDKS